MQDPTAWYVLRFGMRWRRRALSQPLRVRCAAGPSCLDVAGASSEGADKASRAARPRSYENGRRRTSNTYAPGKISTLALDYLRGAVRGCLWSYQSYESSPRSCLRGGRQVPELAITMNDSTLGTAGGSH